MNIETTAHAAQPPIRLGIAGLGLAGSFMVRAAVAHPRIALCAGMDPLPRPREAFAQQFNAPVYSDFHDLCRDQSVEAIYIASPHRFHASQAVEAMEQGKHVLVEKPLALTLGECDEVVAAGGRTGLRFRGGHPPACVPELRGKHRLIVSVRAG